MRPTSLPVASLAKVLTVVASLVVAFAAPQASFADIVLSNISGAYSGSRTVANQNSTGTGSVIGLAVQMNIGGLPIRLNSDYNVTLRLNSGVTSATTVALFSALPNGNASGIATFSAPVLVGAVDGQGTASYRFNFSSATQNLLLANSSYYLVLKTAVPAINQAGIVNWQGTTSAPTGNVGVGFGGNYQQVVNGLDPQGQPISTWTQFSGFPNGGGQNLAFDITGQAAPEPTTCAAFALFGSAGAFAEWKRRRRSRSAKVVPT